MEDIEDIELREKVIEFACNIYKSRSKCIEKSDRRRLTNIAEYMYDNFCKEEPVYEHVAKVLDLKVDRARDKLLNYYLTCIDNKEKKVVLPIVRRVAAKITEPSVKFIQSARLFDKERSELKKALNEIKELEEKKKLPQLQVLKRKKLEDDDPTKILKTKLISQILLQINQKANAHLQEVLSKEIDNSLKLLDELPAISSVFKSITVNALPVIGQIIIPSESREENKLQNMNKFNESTQRRDELPFDVKLDNALTYITKGHRNSNGSKGGKYSATTRNIIEKRVENKTLVVQTVELKDNHKTIALSEIIEGRQQLIPRIIIGGPPCNCKFPNIE
jgi:hypothetical protein